MYLIVNLDGTDDHHDNYYDLFIHKPSRPGYIHLDEESALNEIIRLKQTAPDNHFVLFRAVAQIKQDGVVLEPITTKQGEGE